MRTTDQRVNVGFLGAGYIADWHAAALRTVPGARLAAICDRDEGRARTFAARYGVAQVYSSLGAMLSEGQLDAIHVLLPPDLHAQAAVEIIDAKVDVLLEKPMAIEADACQDLIDHARASGVKVGVGHNFLFAPIYERLKQDLASGQLGRPDDITISWNKGLGQLQSGPFNLWMLRQPGNILLEVGPHSVAHMLDLVGPVEILGVQATNPAELPGGSRFFRRWRVQAGPASIGVTLNFSFSPGFSEHTIHIRGSLAAATADFERNTYLLHRHTPAGMDFDRYHMTAADAKALKQQARGRSPECSDSKIRPTGGSPYGQGIARALQSFYANPAESLDPRLSPELGRDVVRTCVKIGRMAPGTPATRPSPSVELEAPVADGAARTGTPARPEILVLGATGFIGRELGRQLLERGHPIRVLVRNPGRLPAELKDPRVEVVVGDLSRDAGLAPALEGIRCVYHLARSSVKTWEEYVEHEIEPTRRIAEACLAAKVGRLIYTGTIDSYYAGASAGTITEETPLDPHINWRNYYGRAKAISEHLLMELHREKGLPVVIFRPGIVIGRGSSPHHWGIGMWSFDAVCQVWGRGSQPAAPCPRRGRGRGPGDRPRRPGPRGRIVQPRRRIGPHCFRLSRGPGPLHRRRIPEDPDFALEILPGRPGQVARQTGDSPPRPPAAPAIATGRHGPSVHTTTARRPASSSTGIPSETRMSSSERGSRSRRWSPSPATRRPCQRHTPSLLDPQP